MVHRRKRSTNFPQTLTGLRLWLKGTSEGRAMLDALTQECLEEKTEKECRVCQQIRPFPKVLVVLRRLGKYPGAEVYAEEGVMLRFVELPDAPDNAKCGAKLEELIEAKLPKNWRWLVGLPAKRIRGEVFRGISLEETLCYSVVLDTIGEIQAWRT